MVVNDRVQVNNYEVRDVRYGHNISYPLSSETPYSTFTELFAKKSQNNYDISNSPLLLNTPPDLENMLRIDERRN